MLRVVCCTICMYKNKHVLETKRILRGVLWYATVQDPVYHSEMYLVVPLSIPKKTQAWMLRPPKKSRPKMLNARDASLSGNWYRDTYVLRRRQWHQKIGNCSIELINPLSSHVLVALNLASITIRPFRELQAYI